MLLIHTQKADGGASQVNRKSHNYLAQINLLQKFNKTAPSTDFRQ
jgi:hypothetical protein